MLHFIILSAILAVLGQGVYRCTPRYYTVNSFGTVKSFSFSCYGVGSDCEVYYSPPGQGCTGDSLFSIGTVPENETKVLTSVEGFELGSAFCSDDQIGVYFVNETNGDIGVHLPRATEAATKFHLPIITSGQTGSTQCKLFATSKAAEIDINHNGNTESLSIDPYMFQSYTFKYIDPTFNQVLVKFNSSSPVIVSCADVNSPNLTVTLQSISPDPVLINTDNSETMVVVAIDCLTNEWIKDVSAVKVSYATEAGDDCQVSTIADAVDIIAYTITENCVFFVEPLGDNVCVSVGRQTVSYLLIGMGLPELKFPTRFGNYPDVDDVNLLSFVETTCSAVAVDSQESTFNLAPVGGDIPDGVSIADDLKTFSRYSYTVCENSTLLLERNNDLRYPFLSGYQSKELWQPFLTAQCSDARSLVSRIAWVAFFGVYIFSSSLL